MGMDYLEKTYTDLKFQSLLLLLKKHFNVKEVKVF
jgi:hypothetical protein